jgi:multidrug resistance protein MdtO
MASLAQSVQDLPRPSPWLWEFLKDELAPHPGRAGTVARMVIAATVVMIICMTFRIPYGFQGAIYALIVSRENPRATLESAGIMVLVTGVSAAYILISARFVINLPVLHFFWIIVTFFAAFYALSTMTNYVAVTMFANMISVGVPLWDRHVSAETNVEDTLWVVLASSIGVVVTAVVELAFSRMRPGDDIVLPIAEQLDAVQTLLACYADDRSVDHVTENKVVRLAMLGTSTMRRALRRSDYSIHYRAQMSSSVALVGRLVDIAATLTRFRFEPSATDRREFRDLAGAVASIRTDLLNRQVPGQIQFNTDDEHSHDVPSHSVPLLREMANTIALIPESFAGYRLVDEYLPPSDDLPQSKLVAPDAFDNPEHAKFALKGCFAASACYILYNAVAWPGISTAVTTCLLTALSTIGSSRQKQILRLAGAVVGGFLIGMGSQIFILPYLDSIVGFIVLFIFVTALASWIMTSSPRLSYFGLQLALAFYLINLQEFAMQTSLSVARDRVVGILVGLFMMWLVFDQLWSAPAGIEMKRSFVSAFRLLAELAREPVSSDIRTAIKHSYALRETINEQFDRVRSLADGVLFEFGSSRQQGLALRDRIRRWQPQLRTLFLMRVASLKYRLQLPGFELPEAARLSQQRYDDRSAEVLDAMADRIEGHPRQVGPMSEDPFGQLEQKLRACCAKEEQHIAEAHVRSFIILLRGINGLTTSLAEEFADVSTGLSSRKSYGKCIKEKPSRPALTRVLSGESSCRKIFMTSSRHRGAGPVQLMSD